MIWISVSRKEIACVEKGKNQSFAEDADVNRSSMVSKV